MAFKMKGAPMHDLSSKHGTNANYKKSGAPGLLGKILDPLGLKKKLMGGKDNYPPAQAAQAQVGAAKPAEPVTPAAPAAAAPAAPEEAAAPTMMKKGLKNGAPMKPSPAKGIWDDIKSGASKAYDKASQVGMGIKKAAGEVGMYKGTYDDKPTSIGKRLGNLKKAYVKGRDTEERVDKRGGGKGKYKGGRSDEKAFMDNRSKKTARDKASMDIIADRAKTTSYASGNYNKESVAASVKKAQDAYKKKKAAQAKKDYNKGAKS